MAKSKKNKTMSKAEFDQILKDALNTPPLKLKDLKARLKKAREEKRNSRDKKDSK